MKYLSNINLLQNELQNAVIQNLAVAPSNAKAGQIYYNSADKYIYRYDGKDWSPIGVVYNQDSTTGAVITGLDDKGNVTTTNVIGLTLAGYTPVQDGYVSVNMSLQDALAALDTAVKNAVAGGGEVNQNAWSNIKIPKQSDNATTEVAGMTGEATITATSKTDTFSIASGDVWSKVNADSTKKTITLGHKMSGATAGTYGDATHSAKVTVDKAGHVTAIETVAITQPTVPDYTLTKLTTATDGYLASYQLQKDGANIGDVINIPKDYLVKDAELKVSTGAGDASGFPVDTKYIDFTINTYDSKTGTGTTSHIYLNVEDLVDTYTAGNGINISNANVVSAKVVVANGLSLGANGIAMGLASGTENGAMSNTHYAKLEGIAEGATKNTITLNGTATANPSFYAPTGGGTKGQVLTSNGPTATPTWQDAPEAVHKYSAVNGQLTASGGAFTWTIPVGTHEITNGAILINLYEIASGAMVMADVAVNQTTYAVTITINDTASAGTLVAGTYKVVMVG